MVQWPELDELKQMLDVDPTSDAWDGDQYEIAFGPTRLTRALTAAIAQVKRDVGNWDEYTDEPDEALAAAALRYACVQAQRPDLSAADIAKDPQYLGYLRGHRRVWGIG